MILPIWQTPCACYKCSLSVYGFGVDNVVSDHGVLQILSVCMYRFDMDNIVSDQGVLQILSLSVWVRRGQCCLWPWRVTNSLSVCVQVWHGQYCLWPQRVTSSLSLCVGLTWTMLSLTMACYKFSLCVCTGLTWTISSLTTACYNFSLCVCGVWHGQYCLWPRRVTSSLSLCVWVWRGQYCLWPWRRCGRRMSWAGWCVRGVDVTGVRGPRVSASQTSAQRAVDLTHAAPDLQPRTQSDPTTQSDLTQSDPTTQSDPRTQPDLMTQSDPIQSVPVTALPVYSVPDNRQQQQHQQLYVSSTQTCQKQSENMLRTMMPPGEHNTSNNYYLGLAQPLWELHPKFMKSIGTIMKSRCVNSTVCNVTYQKCTIKNTLPLWR